MASHASIQLSIVSDRVRRFYPLILCLLFVAIPIFQGCDDDDPVGPAEPTATPVPSASPQPTITPEPTATPEPTETPMYSGAWCGRTWGNCEDGYINLYVIDGKFINGHIKYGFNRGGPGGYCHIMHFEFQSSIENNGFQFSYQTAPDQYAHERWVINGEFDSSEHIKGYWSYYSTGPFGEGSYFGSGGWSATPN